MTALGKGFFNCSQAQSRNLDCLSLALLICQMQRRKRQNEYILQRQSYTCTGDGILLKEERCCMLL